MTYPFKFARHPEPRLTFGRSRDWGGVGVTEAHATPGRYPGRVTPDHRVIFYLTAGVPTDCRCDGTGAFRIGAPGDFDLVPAEADGVWEDHAACDMLTVRLSPDLLSAAAEALALPPDCARLAPRIGGRDGLVDHVVRSLASELAAPAPAGRLYADGLAQALAVRLLQAGAGAVGRQTLSKLQARRLIDYVEESLDADLSLAELAAVAGVSVPHLTPLFRRTFGRSPHAWVMDRRVCRARDRLLQDDASIAHIALETGFAHQSHLARWMRRRLGVTPSDLRRLRS